MYLGNNGIAANASVENSDWLVHSNILGVG